MATLDSSGIAATSAQAFIETGIFCPWPLNSSMTLEPAIQWFDGLIVMPHDVPGTRVMKGDLAVFIPVKPGEMPLPTKKPIIVKTQRGNFRAVSYAAYAHAQETWQRHQAVAVCTHWYVD